MKMTVKQIAEVAGCHYKTVGYYANKIFPATAEGKGKKRYYDQAQSLAIMEAIPKRKMVIGVKKEETLLPEEKKAPSGLEGVLERMEARQEAFMLKVIEIITPAHAAPITSEIEAPCPVPRLSAPAPEMSSRDRINKIVRGYCAEQRIPYRDGWDRLYVEHKYRCNKDMKLKAKNRGMSTMDLFVKDGEIHNLLAIAIQIYGE